MVEKSYFKAYVLGTRVLICINTIDKILGEEQHKKLSTRATQESEPPDNARANFIVFCLSVAVAAEFRSLTQQTSSKPRTMSLPLVCHDGNV